MFLVTDPPEPPATDAFVLEPLRPDLIDLDTEAYLTSPDVIREHSCGRWPVVGFGREDNLPLVIRHWSDHQARRAFTYLFLDPEGTSSLGCLYVQPLFPYLESMGADAQTLLRYAGGATARVSYWLRQDSGPELAASVAERVDEWLRTSWPLDSYLYRATPEEEFTVSSLDRLPLDRVVIDLPAEPHSYLWWSAQVRGGTTRMVS
ncbi:hypothetical protein FB381_4135 [Nocardioides albertanoniae]|uniref:Uncharacterized protein n=1 Tax=Nocardioides albertanoniae TaxID=1175486 RepID=A0A543ACH3_9ACTN|nr:hypothetical protein [Nocardioides albertanoniae]TQL70206.1 hypothetical protein FB381_4135 [Nocardioides albertanoniae]